MKWIFNNRPSSEKAQVFAYWGKGVSGRVGRLVGSSHAICVGFTFGLVDGGASAVYDEIMRLCCLHADT